MASNTPGTPGENTSSNYIFRLHDDKASDMRLVGWGRSAKMDANKIKTIKDELKKGASKIATSVPSPFARMHLFDTAFKMVAENLEGDSIYHQLVSDCLDMFQLIFSSGNSGDLKFKSWSRAERIQALRSKGKEHPHHLLADSLEMFFTGKFAQVQSITLIYYKNILLGGTSPLTIFFTSPNWQREMAENSIHISSTTNHDEFFDLDFRPLHQRDALFVEFMFRFYLANRSRLNEQCEGLAAYIRNTVERYKKDLMRKATDEWSGYINNPSALDQDYQRVAVVPNSSTFLQMDGMYGYTVKSGDIPDKIQSESDFVIVPTTERYKDELAPESGERNRYRPLVLARGMNMAGTYTYDNTPWNPGIDIRRSGIMDTFGAPIPLSQRFLPGNSGIKYPFLTTEDFLEDALIRMPYKLHTAKFYTGYGGDFQYLLPIKKEYFNYFTIEDLKRNLTILTGDTKITVQLRVPVRNTKGTASILFTKDYEFDKVPVAQCNAGMAIFPFYRITDNDERLQALNEYTVLFAEDNDKVEVTDLAFWRVEDIVHRKKLDVQKPEARTRRSVEGSSYYYKVGEAFDVIELRMKDERQRMYSGIILPQFKEVSNRQATKKYTFSIDLGTSNSHISYLDSPTDRKPKPFEIDADELQTVLLNAPGEGKTSAEKYGNGFGDFREVKSFVDREFVPVIIGKNAGSQVVFPVRTATAEKNTFQSEPPSLFHNISVGFYIDIDATKQDNCVYQTNLKWLFENSRNHSDPDRIEAFLKELLLLIRNKVITTGGSLEDTRVVWLAPLSMKQRSLDLFADKWRKAFDEVFKKSGATLLEPITESIAPYFYLKNNPDANVKDFADALNIDIGGGTTDVMFFMRRSNNYLSTSFRFAGNDIWGDGFNRNEKDNGFMRNFLACREENKKMASTEDDILKKFLDDPTLTSEDVTSLLFRYDEHFRFSESINRQKPQLKLVLFLHYSAIIYHLVQLIEQKDLSIPRYFTFTGKGSQYLTLMCSKDALTRFTKMLLQAYTQRPVPVDFQVVLIANPKEATANGATLFVNSTDRDRISKDSIEVVTQWGAEPSQEVPYKRNVTRVKDVIADTAFKDSVLRNLQAFIEKTLGNEQIATFLAEYEIKGLEDYRRFLLAGDATQSGELYDSFYSLLEAMRAVEGDGISETFFFLALKDTLYTLSKHITAH